MITPASDCLFFEMEGGESLPFSAEMISVELSGDDAELFDPQFLKEATSAVFHYFKSELGQQTITVAEFAGALEKVLRGFEIKKPSFTPSPGYPGVIESDLSRLANEAAQGCELIFFPRLREELRQHIGRAPRLVRFRGLRGCVKQLAGTRRWCGRCRTLHDQIVDYLRTCLQTDPNPGQTAMLVD
jgi:hypothetical protein